MNPTLRKRLEKAEQIHGLGTTQNVIVHQRVNESDEDVQAKIKHWKAGETVDGIKGEYEGGELFVMVIQYVPCKNPFL